MLLIGQFIFPNSNSCTFLATVTFFLAFYYVTCGSPSNKLDTLQKREIHRPERLARRLIERSVDSNETALGISESFESNFDDFIDLRYFSHDLE